MGAWSGDWKGRILAFVRAQGHRGVWDYLRANPGVPLVELADRIGDAAAVQLERLAAAECFANREMGELIRDGIARGVHRHLPGGWGSANDFAHWQAVTLLPLHEPYKALAGAMADDLLKQSPPAKGWLPTSGDDPVLREAYARSLASLSEERRELIARGETEYEPGDRFEAAVGKVFHEVRLGDGEVFARSLAGMRPELRHLYAVRWCDAEVCNGGFHQFYTNSTGVLGPEAAEGFEAIGLPVCAQLVRGTLSFFGVPFPRERAQRVALLAFPGKPHAEGGPFAGADDAYFKAIGESSLALLNAADAYAARWVAS